MYLLKTERMGNDSVPYSKNTNHRTDSVHWSKRTRGTTLIQGTAQRIQVDRTKHTVVDSGHWSKKTRGSWNATPLERCRLSCLRVGSCNLILSSKLEERNVPPGQRRRIAFTNESGLNSLILSPKQERFLIFFKFGPKFALQIWSCQDFFVTSH